MIFIWILVFDFWILNLLFMDIKNIAKTSFLGLISNKSRALLTILGIVIGIASVILMISAGESAKGLILGQMSSLGPKNLFIEPGGWDKKGAPDESMGVNMTTLKYDDIKDLDKEPLIESSAPYLMGKDQIVWKNITISANFIGTTPSAQEINDMYPISGRFFTDEDVRAQSKVAVLGYKIAKDIFGDQDPIGERIKLKKIKLKIIGVMEEQGSQMFQTPDDWVYLPITTAQKQVLGVDYLTYAIAKVADEKTVPEAVEIVRTSIREKHKIDNPENDLGKDDFKITSQVEAVQMVNTITGVLTFLLSAIAAISLVVGGIGIMNIMLVSVTERTKEIGLRKAVGAKYHDILFQFLFEALFLTFSGGVIGIILGISMSALAALIAQSQGYSDWRLVVSWNAIILAVVVSVIVGLVFGIYPAKKAAKQDAIVALRYE